MKRMHAIKIFVTSIIASCVLFVGISVPAYATEEEESVISFNSVVEVESYSVEEGFIEAGKEATVDLILHNANRRTSADSIFVSVSSNSGMIYPAYGYDNQFFAGSLEANGTVTVEIPLVVSSSFAGEYVDLTCNIIYVSNGRQISNTATMILPARNSNSIIVSSVDVGSHATLNNKSLLCVSYYNKSSENINDASLQISGNVSDSTREINLGSVLGGKSYTEDCNIVFTESGEQDISISLTYTDIDGELKMLDLGTFKVDVLDENVSTTLNNGNSTGLKRTGYLITFLAGIAAVVVTVLTFRKR